MEAPALKVEIVPLDSLTPDPDNAKVHTSEQIDDIVESIKAYGFNDPVGIVRDIIVEGEGRWLAMKQLGKTEIPVLRLDHLNDAQRRAYALAHNHLNAKTGFDQAKLKLNLVAIKVAGLELKPIGFAPLDLRKIFAEPKKETDDDADAAAANAANEAFATFSERGDLWVLGNHRLLCGDATSAEDVTKVMGGRQADLVLTDPPYNVAYTGKTSEALTIENDKMSNAQFRDFLFQFYARAIDVTKPGGAIYVFHADWEGYNFRGAMVDAGWLMKQCLIWAKDRFTLGRQDYQWQHEPCHVPGTRVMTPSGLALIEDLKDGDLVVSFDGAQLTPARHIKVASRHFTGNVLQIGVDGKVTSVTPNHKFTVGRSADMWVTYLMKKGSWWRIGISKLVAKDGGCGLMSRLRRQRADAIWPLASYTSKSEACAMEQALAVKYGIPETMWEPWRFGDRPARDAELIEKIYEEQDLKVMREKALSLLNRFGRSVDLPWGDSQTVIAANLIPGAMTIPVPTGDGSAVAWCPIERVDQTPHDGLVYSLEVEKDEHYIADGIVTHNCLYGWKPGAAHQWYSDRTQTTILKFGRPSRNGEHPTMKPVDMVEYLMKNSTELDGLVFEPFAGSGTTLIAAEQTGRQCCAIELSPRYASVIVERWAKLTKLEPVLHRNGTTMTMAEAQACRSNSSQSTP